MTSQIDDLKSWGAEAIVAFPQWEGMEVPIQEAIDEGIVVVNFDIEIAADGVYRVSGDNESMGVEGAKYIVDKIGTTGKVVVLDVPTSGSVAELRKKGFLDTMKEIAPDMEIVEYATQFTREAGQADFADILTSNDHIDAVYSMDDETSIGVLQAISEANRDDIKVITGGGGYPFFPGYTLTTMLGVFVYSLFFYKSKITFSRAFWAKLLTNIQNVILGALWMAILSGKAWYVTASGSAIKNLICLPFQAILLYTLFTTLRPFLVKMRLIE